MAYLEMGLWLFAEDDYVEAATKVTGVLDELGTWSAPWSAPTSSAVTQARKRLGPAVMADVFERVALPLAEPLTTGAWLGTFPGPTWRMVAIDGFDLDLPDTPRQRRGVRTRRDRHGDVLDLLDLQRWCGWFGVP